MNNNIVSFTRAVSISALSLGFWAAATHSSSAQELLIINDSNPSAVVITATGADAGVNYCGNTGDEGVDLLQFFTQNEAGLIPSGNNGTQTLTGSNMGGVIYWLFSADDESAPGVSFNDLNLSEDNVTEEFSTTDPAFSGTWTIDFSSWGVSSAALPTPGTGGDIMSGNSTFPGEVVGQWEVQAVPEPGTTSLAVAGFAVTGIAMFRQRRKLAKS